jgi:hypothetical protein
MMLIVGLVFPSSPLLALTAMDGGNAGFSGSKNL